jgi:23S rRNA pseudouridine2605 synthase
MRINKWIAGQMGIGRRTVDELILHGNVVVNGQIATIAQQIDGTEQIVVNGKPIATKSPDSATLLLHKPVGYVCSRNGQGSKTVYDLLPAEYEDLKIAGRLDRDSSGLVVMSRNGDMIQELSHPSQDKKKTYRITTRRPLTTEELDKIQNAGVDIGDDRLSRFSITPTGEDCTYIAVLTEGRNRQIRRTIEALHTHVQSLQRTHLGPYSLDNLDEGAYQLIDSHTS